MHIKRITIEGGFLDGLDLSLGTGLTAVIGPRGSGKTSLIELVRYALDTPRYVGITGRDTHAHAESVLQDGTVRVELAFLGEDWTVERTTNQASGAAPEVGPVILAQNEVELIGLSPNARLKLLDEFVEFRPSLLSQIDACLAKVNSIGAQRLSAKVHWDDAVEDLEIYHRRIKAAESALERLAPPGDDVVVQALVSKLVDLDGSLATESLRTSLLTAGSSSLAEWTAALSRIQESAPQLPDWPAQVSRVDELSEARNTVSVAIADLRSTIRGVQESASLLGARVQEIASRVAPIRERSRTLRKQLEGAQEGAGKRARELAALADLKAKYEAHVEVVAAKEREWTALSQSLSKAVDELFDARDQLFKARQSAGRMLNANLAGSVRVGLLQHGTVDKYTDAILGALRGTRLRYRDLAPALGMGVDPRELAKWVDTGDVAALESVLGIRADRAQKVLGALREAGTHTLLAAPIDDSVSVSLLVGGDYRDSTELSMGQRCAAILPILLAHRSVPIILDQPEDHLDNRFVVATLVDAILRADDDSQIIVSTHNANIPVLGDAAKVVVMDSDGKKGSVVTVAQLDDPETVAAITSLMEGGKKAFATRAELYGRQDEP